MTTVVIAGYFPSASLVTGVCMRGRVDVCMSSEEKREKGREGEEKRGVGSEGEKNEEEKEGGGQNNALMRRPLLVSPAGQRRSFPPSHRTQTIANWTGHTPKLDHSKWTTSVCIRTASALAFHLYLRLFPTTHSLSLLLLWSGVCIARMGEDYTSQPALRHVHWGVCVCVAFALGISSASCLGQVPGC